MKFCWPQKLPAMYQLPIFQSTGSPCQPANVPALYPATFAQSNPIYSTFPGSGISAYPPALAPIASQSAFPMLPQAAPSLINCQPIGQLCSMMPTTLLPTIGPIAPPVAGFWQPANAPPQQLMLVQPNESMMPITAPQSELVNLPQSDLIPLMPSCSDGVEEISSMATTEEEPASILEPLAPTAVDANSDDDDDDPEPPVLVIDIPEDDANESSDEHNLTPLVPCPPSASTTLELETASSSEAFITTLQPASSSQLAFSPNSEVDPNFVQANSSSPISTNFESEHFVPAPEPSQLNAPSMITLQPAVQTIQFVPIYNSVNPVLEQPAPNQPLTTTITECITLEEDEDDEATDIDEEYAEEVTQVIPNPPPPQPTIQLVRAPSNFKPKPTHSCPDCDRHFYNNSDLATHRSKVHNIPESGRNYICDRCGAAFRQATSLIRHNLENHSETKPFSCRLCSARFKNKYLLQAHQTTHQKKLAEEEAAKKVFKCPKCDKKYDKRFYLKRHLVVHSDQLPHVCKICGKGFAQISSLNRHMMLHSEVRKYICGDCGKSYRWRDSLVSHLMTHNDKRSYICDGCGMGFKVADYLKRHVCRQQRQDDDEEEDTSLET